MKDGAEQEFISEAEELLESLGKDLLRYEEAMLAGGKINPDILNGVFRAAHSLKGLAGMFGRQQMSKMAHSMESLLDSMRLGKTQRDPLILDALFEAVDKLRGLLKGEEIKGGIKPTVAKLEDAMKGKLATKAPPEKADGATAETSGPEGDIVVIEGVPISKSVMDVLTEYEEFRLMENIQSGSHLLKVSASFELLNFDTELPNLMNWLKERGEVITTLPGGNEAAPDKIHFELLVGTETDLGDLENLLKERDASMTVLKKGESGKAAAVEGASPAGTAPAAPPAAGPVDAGEGAVEDDATSVRSISRTVRVDIKRLDNLMNIVGELALEKTIIGNIRDSLRHQPGFRDLANDLYKAHRNLERKLTELQDAVMEVRMVPVGQLFGRLGRIIRKISREADKEIKLVRSGADTELDKLIIEELSDPLMHIIRNSIDHGIEPSGTRKRRGKPKAGTVELRAFQQGNHVVIQVEDDGAGIDAERVYDKAVKMGLAEPGVELKREDIFRFLFEPGFSTKDSVSELSGRGVGLDVVRQNIGNLSGMIDIESEVGVGALFTITLPITLAIIQALIVDIDKRVYALPLNSVRECHVITPRDIRTIEQREVMELRERTIPLLRLGQLFGHGGGEDDTGNGSAKKGADSLVLEPVPEGFVEGGDLDGEEGKQFVVVVGIAEKRLGVLVDSLKGRQDVVIKGLGGALGNIPGVAGATDLGNQQTVLILDVGDLISETAQSSAAGKRARNG